MRPVLGPLDGAVSSSISFDMRDLSWARRWSVPLCLGTIDSISCRTATLACGDLASRKRCSASRY